LSLGLALMFRGVLVHSADMQFVAMNASVA